MYIKIKTLDEQLHNIEVESEEKVTDLLQKVAALYENVPIDQIRLFYDGKLLKSNKTIKNYEIKNGAIVNYILALRSV